MRSRNFLVGLMTGVIVLLIVSGTVTRADAQQEKVLHNFNNGITDGAQPYSGLIVDAAGNLYGTTVRGGAYGLGTAFELKRTAGGGWAEEILHNFSNSADGQYANASLIFDAFGNLYSTTYFGAAYNAGSVLELTALGSGWKETILHSFNTNGRDGQNSEAGLILNSSGNLYGTTVFGGTATVCDGGCGTFFEVAPTGSGDWTERVLHSFNAESDGAFPYATLLSDAAGNLYGTTAGGGDGSGTVFELKPTAGGSWAEKILHSFANDGRDGNVPYDGLVFDASGNLYGTTSSGGTSNGGTVFELKPSPSGNWAETVLYSFILNSNDGHTPVAALVSDASGNLYGTTLYGGIYTGGTVFELARRSGGNWTERILHSFNVDGTDGQNPYAPLVFDAAGNLYGTTFEGGAYDGGVVFEITP